MRHDECGDSLVVVQVELRQLRVDLGVGGDGDDVRILRIQESLPCLGTVDLQLRDRREFVSFDDQQGPIRRA